MPGRGAAGWPTRRAARPPGRAARRAGTQPPAVCPRVHCTHGADALLPETSFSGGQRGDASPAGTGSPPLSGGGAEAYSHKVPAPGAAHGSHREQLSASKATVRANTKWLHAPAWDDNGSTERACPCFAGLCAHCGQRGAAPLPGPPGALRLRTVTRVRRGPGLGGRRRAEARGPFGVLDIETPEVKFLDRSSMGCGGGVVWLMCVRRSRTRVWGAKMIRYRRSPWP